MNTDPLERFYARQAHAEMMETLADEYVDDRKYGGSNEE